jgi:hypothetical protein
MHLWFKIGAGPIIHASNADTNLPTAPTRVYVGCHSTTGYEANGVIDALQLVDLEAEASMGTVINNSWVEGFLTAASPPACSPGTRLLANLDDALTAGRGGTYIHPVQDISGAGAYAAAVSYSETIPSNTSLTFESRKSADGGLNWSTWTAKESGDIVAQGGEDLVDYRLQWRINLTSTSTDTPALNDATITITPFHEFDTMGRQLNVWQPGTGPWASPKYRTSQDGVVWEDWQDISPSPRSYEVPYPGKVRLGAYSRIKGWNWKKPFEETDAVTGFVMVSD